MFRFFIILFFTLSSCSTNYPTNKWMENSSKPKILSTTAMIGALVSKIGQDEIDHLTLINGDLDPHSYELIKGDDEKIKRADVLFFNGLGLEHGASLHTALYAHPHGIALGPYINKENLIYVDGYIDPHLWMDMSLWKKIVDPIANELALCDPGHADLFYQRAEIVKQEIQATHEKIYNSLQHIPEQKRFLVSSHDAFRYFARAYLKTPEETTWEHRCSAPEGLSPEGAIGLGHIQEVLNYICAHEIHIIFPESNVNQDALKKIISVAHHKNLSLSLSKRPLFSDSLGPYDYLSMMEYNAGLLCECWEESTHASP